MADFHCGHMVGLTPPEYQTHDDLKRFHRKLWSWFEGELPKADILFLLGDLIDGEGTKSRGTELTHPDVGRQIDMAVNIIERVQNRTGVRKIYGVYGTPYHASPGGNDLEHNVLNRVGGTIGSHEWVDVNGVMFDLKHDIGSSSVPYGQGTPLNKEHTWNLEWALKEEYNPKSDVILRGHVHRYDFAGSVDYLAMSLPALQGPGSKFGKRRCSRTVHFGFVHFDVGDEGGYSWVPHILRFKEQVKAHKA